MRICMLSNALSVHTQRWARSFAERGHEVHLLSIRKSDVPGVAVHTLCVGPVNSESRTWTFLSYVRLLLAARRMLKRIAPDILNAHFTVTHGVVAAFAGFRPRIISCWGSDVLPDDKGNMSWVCKRLNRWALRKPDFICSTSEYMVAHARRFSDSAVPIAQVPFGVDCNRFRPATASEQRTAGEFRIGFVKTLAPKYGPDVLIAAMPRVIEAVPDAVLIMAGRGQLRQRLETLADELGVADRVRFCGFVQHDELPNLIRSFDILVNCSRLESFGVSLLEASACGVPVVATRVGGVPEVCRDGETGFLVDCDAEAIAQAIIRLASDEELRERMTRAARQFVLQHYVWDNNVDTMLSLMQSLVAARRSSAGVPGSEARL